MTRIQKTSSVTKKNKNFETGSVASTNIGSRHNFEKSYVVDEDMQPIGLRNEQLYRMLDKFYHTLAQKSSDESFSLAKKLFEQVTSRISKKEYDMLGTAWRDLYTDSSDENIATLKRIVDSVKSNFS